MQIGNESSMMAAKNTQNQLNKIDNNSALSRLSQDFGNFIKLLTVQLENQDPTEPLNPNEFTQQIVEFTGVEQSINTNKYLEKLIEQNESNQMNNIVSYIDKNVEYNSNELLLANSEATFTYQIPENASHTMISIVNSSGRVVHTMDADRSAGKHTVNWDGKGFEGNQNDDGVYKVIVTASDAKGKPMDDIKVSTVGKVTGAIFSNNNVELNIGNKIDIPLSNILAVKSSNS